MDQKVLAIEELPSIKEKFSLVGKTAFVTGAAGGIGRSSAAAMAELGANVVLMDIPPKKDALEHCADEIAKRYGVKTLALTGDVLDEESVGEMYDKIEEVFGTVDIVHSNAGINVLDDNSGISSGSWEKMMKINVNGAVLIARYGAEMMREHGHGGSVIMTASMSGSAVNRLWDTDLTQMAYCTTKGAIKQFTKSMAMAYSKYGIRVNSISPGYILSGLHDKLPKEFFDFSVDTVPMKRFGALDEIVGVIAMMASDIASYMTGSDVIVDGGYTVW